MVDEVAKNVFRIDVELPGNPLRATNSYFIRSILNSYIIGFCIIKMDTSCSFYCKSRIM